MSADEKSIKTLPIIQRVNKWAATWDFQQCCMCYQKSLRSACAYAQSDQSLCLLLECSMTVKLLTEHHLEFLSLKGDCTCSSENTLVKMPHCCKSHVVAQMHQFHSMPYTTSLLCVTENWKLQQGCADMQARLHMRWLHWMIINFSCDSWIILDIDQNIAPVSCVGYFVIVWPSYFMNIASYIFAVLFNWSLCSILESTLYLILHVCRSQFTLLWKFFYTISNCYMTRENSISWMTQFGSINLYVYLKISGLNWPVVFLLMKFGTFRKTTRHGRQKMMPSKKDTRHI